MLVHKTTKLVKKYKTIRFKDSEGGVDYDTLIDYYKPYMGFVEIAEELDVSVVTIRSDYDKAMNKLEELLDLNDIKTADAFKDILGGAEKHYSKIAM